MYRTLVSGAVRVVVGALSMLLVVQPLTVVHSTSYKSTQISDDLKGQRSRSHMTSFL